MFFHWPVFFVLVHWIPNKHETLNQCWVDVGPTSLTVGQHQPNIGSMSRVCWAHVPRWIFWSFQSFWLKCIGHACQIRVKYHSNLALCIYGHKNINNVLTFVHNCNIFFSAKNICVRVWYFPAILSCHVTPYAHCSAKAKGIIFLLVK